MQIFNVILDVCYCWPPQHSCVCIHLRDTPIQIVAFHHGKHAILRLDCKSADLNNCLCRNEWPILCSHAAIWHVILVHCCYAAVIQRTQRLLVYGHVWSYCIYVIFFFSITCTFTCNICWSVFFFFIVVHRVTWLLHVSVVDKVVHSDDDLFPFIYTNVCQITAELLVLIIRRVTRTKLGHTEKWIWHSRKKNN
jgi:hypothetical protein